MKCSETKAEACDITSYLAGGHSILQDFLSLVVGNGRRISPFSVSVPALQAVPNSHTTHCTQTEARTHTHRHTRAAYK